MAKKMDIDTETGVIQGIVVGSRRKGVWLPQRDPYDSYSQKDMGRPLSLQCKDYGIATRS